MTRILSSRMFCVTMFLLFALALMANSFAGGTLPRGEAFLPAGIRASLSMEETLAQPCPITQRL